MCPRGFPSILKGRKGRTRQNEEEYRFVGTNGDLNVNREVPELFQIPWNWLFVPSSRLSGLSVAVALWFFALGLWCGAVIGLIGRRSRLNTVYF